jgi:hypothetical protein
MKKLIFTFSIICCCIFAAQSQSTYKTAIGLRLGYPWSASLKHFISEKGAVEIYAGFRGYVGYRWVNIGGLYQHHSQISDVEGLQWYVGGGGSIYFWSFNNGFNNNDAANTSFGLSGCLGLDYKFADVPFQLSVDWVPTFFVNGYGNGFGAGYGALAARYTLK